MGITCANYQPDHNGECRNCDEPYGAHVRRPDPSCHACGGPIAIGEPIALYHEACDPLARIADLERDAERERLARRIVDEELLHAMRAVMELERIERAAEDWGCRGSVQEFLNLLGLNAQRLEREVALFKEQAHKWNVEADTYLAQRDDLERENKRILDNYEQAVAAQVEALEREVARLKAEPIPGFYRDDGTEVEDLSGIPNGFREHVEKVARGEADIETLLPNWSYIRRLP